MLCSLPRDIGPVKIRRLARFGCGVKLAFVEETMVETSLISTMRMATEFGFLQMLLASSHQYPCPYELIHCSEKGPIGQVGANNAEQRSRSGMR